MLWANAGRVNAGQRTEDRGERTLDKRTPDRGQGQANAGQADAGQRTEDRDKRTLDKRTPDGTEASESPRTKWEKAKNLIRRIIIQEVA
jgi:hypothetical protein